MSVLIQLEVSRRFPSAFIHIKSNYNCITMAESGQWRVFNSFEERKQGRDADQVALAAGARRPHSTLGAFRLPIKGIQSKGRGALQTRIWQELTSLELYCGNKSVQSTHADSIMVWLSREDAITALNLSQTQGTADFAGVEPVSLPQYHAGILQRIACDPLSAVHREEMRSEAMDNLRRLFHHELELNNVVNKSREAFNRWIFEQIGEKQSDLMSEDPLLPTQPTVRNGDSDPALEAYKVSPSLFRELLDDLKGQQESETNTHTDEEKVTRICQCMAANADKLATELIKSSGEKVNFTYNVKASTQVSPAQNGLGDVVRMTLLRGNTVAWHNEMLSPYWQKLVSRIFHRTMHQQEEGDTFTATKSTDALFRVSALLTRYRALAGGTVERDNAGSGHHCAIPPAIMETFQRRLGVAMEGFASPLNVHLPYFNSAFLDTDAPFGSLGSFFHTYFAEGSIEVNPPFVEEVMQRMHDHIELLLKAAGDRPLSFTIVVPEWRKPVTPSIAAIEANKTGSLSRAIRVPLEDHCYLDGFQHTLKDAPFRPVHNTMIYVMQNRGGRQKWVCDDAAEADILTTWKNEAAKCRPNPLVSGNIPEKKKRTREEE